MTRSAVSRSSPADLDKLQFIGLLGCIVMLGLAVRVFLLVQTAFWSLELERVVALVPIAVGVITYVRKRPETAIWEIGAVALWGVLARWVADAAWFFVGPALLSNVSISAIVLTGVNRFYLLLLLRFLGTTVLFAGFYAAAASRRDRAIQRAITLLALPVVIVVFYGII